MPWDDKIGRRLKLKDLQTLMTVVDAGGMGKAADRLHYSQPTVSKAIATLERTLVKRLLERGRKGTELTPYGEALLKCGVAVFDDLRKGVSDIEFLSDPTVGEVRVGCTEPVSAGIVSALLNRLVEKYPRITFHFEVSGPTSICRALDVRSVDFVITQIIAPIEDDHLQVEVLYDESVVIVASARHPVANKRRIGLREVADARWVLPPPQSFISSMVAEAFRAEGLKPPIVAVMAHSAYWRIMLAASGRFLTVVPAVMLKVGFKHLSVKALPIRLAGSKRPIALITLKDRALSPVAQLVIEHTRAIAKIMARS